jgi:hypothetical protein
MDVAMIARAGCGLLLAVVAALAVLAVDCVVAGDWSGAALAAVYAVTIATARRWVGVLGRLAEDE